MVGAVLSLKTIANNCFSLTPEGTERTASFGGPTLGAPSAAPTLTPGMNLG